jgi:hypothetical protein
MTTTLNASTAGAGGFIATSDNSGVLALQTAGTTAITVDTSQRVGIGNSATSPSNLLVLRDTNDITFSISKAGVGGFDIKNSGTSGTTLGTQDPYILGFKTNDTERMRIDSSGNLLVGTTSSSLSSGVGFKFTSSSTVPNVGQVVNTSGSTNTYHYYNDNATNGGYRFYVNVNGGIYNFSGNNSNLSDERTKTNITLADNYLDKICAIPVKTFNYKDEPSGEQKTLGLIAQDVQRIAPEFVNSDGKWEVPEGESPLLSIYSTDMMFALMKSIQELKAINDTQAETINALTARIVALEQA